MALPKLIGIYSPAPQSGKTTLATILVRDHGYRRISFADPLRDMIRVFLRGYGLSNEEIATFMVNKTDTIPCLGRSLRYLLQTLGTEWGRDLVKPSVWTHALELRLLSPDLAQSRVVIDDMRFRAEYQMIRHLGGATWRLTNPRIPLPVAKRTWMERLLRRPPRSVHRSELALERCWFDVQISNAGSIADLMDHVELIFDNGVDAR